MNAMTFDTHAYVRKLKSVGFTEEQAEVQAEVLYSIFEKNLGDLATRRDLQSLELSMKRDFQLEIEKVRKELAESKADMIKWVLGVAAGQAALIIAILRMSSN